MASERLIDQFDAVLSDLDGVVYAGPDAIPGAPEALEEVKSGGRPVIFVTNNASRSVDQVAEHLTELGVETTGEAVISSAQAAAGVLKERLAAGTNVLITGSQALAQLIEEAGLNPVWSQEEEPRAVVQGFDPGLGWKDLAEAAYVLADRGVLWMATNTDASIPQQRGIAPGNGTLVDAVSAATRRTPEVAGKPEAPIFVAGAQRVGSTAPVVIGDRLDTDILGGNRAGFATIAVLTGVDTPESILGAVTEQRPRYIIKTLAGLFEPMPSVHIEIGDDGSDDGLSGHWVEATSAGVTARAQGESVVVSGDDDDLDAWRAACAAWWKLHPDVTEPTRPRVVWEHP
ncbi:HAD-IIA family hydrolase [Kocuria coralli]|uniref:HAD-IIA family hydrolase n=1 Tax=Kocuria coralli TaxID=1461025 RepID=UPI001FECDBDC|nr:HAD-IIA family hydrolase [Kocuria coralli]